MKTTNRSPRLCSWVLRSASVLLGVVFCTSALAETTGKNVVATKSRPATQVRHVKKYYVLSTASSIPIPVEQLGVFPTTTHPIQIIGRGTFLGR